MPLLTIDHEFQALCPPLQPEEMEQLKVSLVTEGCRERLSVWQDGTHILLLDGHNRYAICTQYDIPYAIHLIDLDSREEAINWIIANQLGRRNLTPEQKSYLRGKRFQSEKRHEGRPEKRDQNDPITERTSERLATEYKVHPNTIKRDEQFATAVDTLEAQVRQDIRNSILHRQDREEGKISKQQAMHTGKLVQDETVSPQPFMRREGWKPYQVLEAIEVLAALPSTEHAAVNRLLDGPYIPAKDGLGILANLASMPDETRQHLYALLASPERRDQDLALALASKKAPPPDPQSQLAEGLILALQQNQQRLRRNWINAYPHEAWSDALRDLEADLVRMITHLTAIQAQVDTAHQERMAPYGTTV